MPTNIYENSEHFVYFFNGTEIHYIASDNCLDETAIWELYYIDNNGNLCRAETEEQIQQRIDKEKKRKQLEKDKRDYPLFFWKKGLYDTLF